jgi:hypothetical protein
MKHVPDGSSASAEAILGLSGRRGRVADRVTTTASAAVVTLASNEVGNVCARAGADNLDAGVHEDQSTVWRSDRSNRAGQAQ